MRQRIWLIDGLRSGAILLMILYHFLFDLQVFYQRPLGLWEFPWPEFRITVAASFIFLSGYSLTLSSRPVRHGLELLGFSIAVTGVSVWFNPFVIIIFGVLHLLGISYLLGAWVFSRLPYWVNFVLAALLLSMAGRTIGFPPVLLPLGDGGEYFPMMDYYPLIPWLSPFLFGVVAGQIGLFKKFVSTKESWLLLPGRYSIWIYLIHQPILLGALYLYYGR